MLHPQCIEDADFSLTSFIAFCEAVNRTPNALLGYDEAPASSGWRSYPANRPDEGQRIVIYRKINKTTLQGEFVYQGGDFYFPEFCDPDTDAPANVPGVIAWIEIPEG